MAFNGKLLIVDDDCGRFGPLVDRRPVFSVRTGCVDTKSRIERAVGSTAQAVWVPQRYREAIASQHACPINSELEGDDWLVVNGRWLATDHVSAVKGLSGNEALTVAHGDQVVAVRFQGATASLDAQAWLSLAEGDARKLGDRVRSTPLPGDALIQRPWHILDVLRRTLLVDLSASDLPSYREHSATGLVHKTGDHPVRIASSAQLLGPVSINTTLGPVVIEAGASVHPFCSLEGPCFIGAGATIAAHTALRPDVVIGTFCKVGGEISGSVMQGWSNKAHLGYLGNALVGEWCNLGAATTVSNLKNTYSPVRVQLTAESNPEDTGRQFHGPILGDFVRTAIGTRIMTGSCIGTGNMIATSAFAPKFARPFGFYVDDPQGGRLRKEHDFDGFVQTAKTMMARRDRDLSDEEVELLRTLQP